LASSRELVSTKARRGFRQTPSESGAAADGHNASHGFGAGGVLRVYVSPVTRQFACVVALLLKDSLMGRAMASSLSQGMNRIDEHQAA